MDIINNHNLEAVTPNPSELKHGKSSLPDPVNGELSLPVWYSIFSQACIRGSTSILGIWLDWPTWKFSLTGLLSGILSGFLSPLSAFNDGSLQIVALIRTLVVIRMQLPYWVTSTWKVEACTDSAISVAYLSVCISISWCCREVKPPAESHRTAVVLRHCNQTSAASLQASLLNVQYKEVEKASPKIKDEDWEHTPGFTAEIKHVSELAKTIMISEQKFGALSMYVFTSAMWIKLKFFQEHRQSSKARPSEAQFPGNLIMSI